MLREMTASMHFTQVTFKSRLYVTRLSSRRSYAAERESVKQDYSYHQLQVVTLYIVVLLGHSEASAIIRNRIILIMHCSTIFDRAEGLFL